MTLPAEEQAARRKEVDVLLAVASNEKKRKSFRWLEGFAETCDVAQIDREPGEDRDVGVRLGLLIAVAAGALIGQFWVILGIAPP